MENADELFRLTFELSPVGIAHVGIDGGWIRVNPRLCRLLGYTEEEFLATRFQDLTHPDDLAEDLRLATELLAGKIPEYELEKRYIRKDGSFVWARLLGVLRRDADGQPLHFISIVQDISARKAAEDALRRANDELESRVAERTRELETAIRELDRLVTHDPLTGLLNRRGVLQKVAELQGISARTGHALAMFYMDLDGFKRVNDLHGHEAGDVVLKTCADRIRGRLRVQDGAGRLGGDEFIAVLETDDPRSMSVVAESLLEALNQPIMVESGGNIVECRVGVSIGVLVVARSIGLRAALCRADRAMYRAKAAGGGIEIDAADAGVVIEQAKKGG